MLKRYNQLFLKLFILNDLTMNTLAWLLAYWVHFELASSPEKTYSLGPYLLLLPFINFFWPFIFRENKLYEPKRGSSRMDEFFHLFKSVTVGVIIITGMMFFYRGYSYSRMVVFYFWCFDLILLQFSRTVVRSYLSYLRSRGYNLRYMLIVGAGGLGRLVKEKIDIRPGLGYKVIGFVDDDPLKVGTSVEGVKVLGTCDNLMQFINIYRVDEVIIALPLTSHERIFQMATLCQKEGLRVRIVPDLLEVITHQASIDQLDGIPLIGLDRGALEHLGNRIKKRLEDIIISSFALLIFAPVMVLIAVLIKLTSKGPIFYRQERIGLDRHPFNMLKFRSMHLGAEKESGPVWCREQDSRRTRLGSFLRSTSLDELPQLFNVLRGEMSLVGPRPERPYFAHRFKEEIDRYMERHHVKAGITGWAQVNGWRGNTSLEKRIEHDIYYIENWSLALDLKILWMTVWRGFINDNAY